MVYHFAGANILSYDTANTTDGLQVSIWRCKGRGGAGVRQHRLRSLGVKVTEIRGGGDRSEAEEPVSGEGEI